MKKLSVIRGDSVPTIDMDDTTSGKCPYGLSITSACKDVGDAILTMTAVEDIPGAEKQTTQKNRVIYHTQKVGERCPYANEILEKFNKVDCSWGDSAAGEHTGYLTPSPLYPKTFIGDGLEPGSPNKGQDIYDPRQYFDAPERGIDVPYGLFSIFANRSNELGMLRLAEKYTNKSSIIRDKLAFLREQYFNTLKSIIPSSSVVKLSEEQLEKLLFVVDDWTK